MGYTGSVDLVSGIRPKNNGTFPLVDAKDVRVDDNTRLDAALATISPVVTGAVRYDVAQTLTDAQKQQARENIGAGEVDDTLSVEGMAADAKKTGDEISALKDNINEMCILNSGNVNDWEQGFIRSTSGTLLDADNRVRTQAITFPSGIVGGVNFAVASGYSFGYREYSRQSGTGFVYTQDWTEGPLIVELDASHSFKFVLKKNDDSNFTPDDVVEGTLSYTYYTFTDAELEMENKAADAKIVGDRITSLESDVASSYKLATGTVIPVDSNLDSYTTPGVFYAASGDAAGTMHNTPVENMDASFKLIVNQINSATRIKQEVIINNQNSGFERWYDGSNWSTWQRFAYIADVESQISDAVSTLNTISKTFNTAAFETGAILPTTGVNATSSTRIRSTGFIPNQIASIKATSEHGGCLFAYLDGVYVGYWDGSQFVQGDVTFQQEIVITDIPNYTNYDFRLVIRNADGSTIDEIMAGISYTLDTNLNALASTLDDAVALNTQLAAWPPIFAAPDDTSVLSSAALLWAEYDKLMSAYPDYVTKNTLTSGTFSNYEYVFTMGAYNAAGRRSRDSKIAKPVILIDSGVHGYERSSVMSLLAFCKELCANTGPLAVLRDQYTFRIIPCVCPWGFTNNTRWNEAGVNINRNFDANWVLTGEAFEEDYSGPSAASEPETKVMQDWIDAHLPTAQALIDFHNSGYTNEVAYISGINTTPGVPEIKSRFRDNINKIIGYWQNIRSMLSSDLIYEYTGQISTGGTVQTYGNTKSKPALTVETSWNQNSFGKHSNVTIGVGAEALACVVESI